MSNEECFEATERLWIEFRKIVESKLSPKSIASFMADFYARNRAQSATFLQALADYTKGLR